MDNEQLRTQLEDLHAELQKAEALDPQQRELLQALANDINQLLSRNENEPYHYRSLGERLSEDVARLEASHPQITLLMRRAIDSLAYLGV
jgi:predicted  nucleic acid-binding Zn-ribbon protein